MILRIIIFYTIAISISNVFRFDLLGLNGIMEDWPAWLRILSQVFLEGSGVLLGALISLKMLAVKRKPMMSLLGTSKTKSLLMLIVPVILLAVIGVENEHGVNAYAYGLIVGIGTLIYCIEEELGWRGYLQDELSAQKPWLRYLIIGFLWYLWHLSFLTETSVQDNLFFLSMLVFASWGIGQIAIATKSVIACACFHMIINIMMFNQLIKNGISGNEKLLILGVTLAVWIYLVSKWRKGEEVSNSVHP